MFPRIRIQLSFHTSLDEYMSHDRVNKGSLGHPGSGWASQSLVASLKDQESEKKMLMD